jgi:Helix-turn-helix domain
VTPTVRMDISRRLMDREQAASYCGDVSIDTIDRLINSGELPVVRLPIQRSRTSGKGVNGVNRRILIDIKDLDALIERSKERRV